VPREAGLEKAKWPKAKQASNQPKSKLNNSVGNFTTMEIMIHLNSTFGSWLKAKVTSLTF
jgi:hypothetical protein